MKNIFLFFLVIFFCVSLLCQTKPETDFEKTVKKHLTAIDNKNFKEFKSTITNSNKISLILPNGMCFSSRAQFLDFTKTWFQEKNWRMKYSILEMKETPKMGFVLLMVNYSDINKNNKQ